MGISAAKATGDRKSANVIMRSCMPAALLAVSSHGARKVQLVLVSSVRSSPHISEQKRDCSQCIEDIKIF